MYYAQYLLPLSRLFVHLLFCYIETIQFNIPMAHFAFISFSIGFNSYEIFLLLMPWNFSSLLSSVYFMFLGGSLI